MLLKKFTLLYVEDDKTTQGMIKILLKNKVKELYIASDGQEGLDIYKDKNPDIILTDINMPIMDGLEMSAKIKSINHHQPIICLTAYSDIDFLKESINIGIDKYLIKPISDTDIFFSTLDAVAKDLQSDIDKIKLEKMLQSQAKVAAMGEMIGNIAHQWRQPLSAITTAASGISMNHELNTLTDDMLDNMTSAIVTQAMHLSQTIDDFRDFFKDTDTSNKEFNLKNTLDKTISLTSDSYNNHYIEVIYSCEDIFVTKNQNQLSQVLLNIFNNAKDAFIINNIKHDRYLFIDIKQIQDDIVISCKDNAGGIPTDIIDKVFEPYFTTKHQSQGTGIGLYMTNQIITKHFGGTINAQNIEYNYNDQDYIGAIFTIKFSNKES